MTAPQAAAAGVVPRGILFLVVGPSGAGKDSLIRAAKESLSDSPLFHFPRRVVTRPEDLGSEDFESVTPSEFERRRAAGGFCLYWDAHGLSYGVPATAEEALEAGRSIVVNVSRTVIAAASRRFPVRVIQVTAPQAVLEQRLADRRRTSDGDLGARLARRIQLHVEPAVEMATIVNDRSLEVATAAMMDILLRQRHP